MIIVMLTILRLRGLSNKLKSGSRWMPKEKKMKPSCKSRKKRPQKFKNNSKSKLNFKSKRRIKNRPSRKSKQSSKIKLHRQRGKTQLPN